MTRSLHGVVYLVCFETAIGDTDNPKGSASHYVGAPPSSEVLAEIRSTVGIVRWPASLGADERRVFQASAEPSADDHVLRSFPRV